MTDGACADDQARRSEENMLNMLDWDCVVMTSVQWLALYLQMICKEEGECFSLRLFCF